METRHARKLEMSALKRKNGSRAVPSWWTEPAGLVPALVGGTTYFYSVGTTTETLAGGDAQHVFITAPAPGTSRPTHIWVTGGSGTADANSAAVRDAYLNVTGATYTDLWLALGDQALPAGTDAEHQTALFGPYAALLRQTGLWPTLGEAEAQTVDVLTQSGPYFDAFTLPSRGEAGGEASGTSLA